MADAEEIMERAMQHARQVLVGERVRLRELHDGDLPHLVRWWRDPRVAVFNNMIHPRPDKALEDQFREWSLNESTIGAALCVETIGGSLVGHVALFGAEGRNRCATFGIMIGPEHQSKGLGTEATSLMVGFGFRELGLHRIELTVNADNVRAIAAYDRAGFVQEGVMSDKIFYDGAFHDQVLMAALSPLA